MIETNGIDCAIHGAPNKEFRTPTGNKGCPLCRVEARLCRYCEKRLTRYRWRAEEWAKGEWGVDGRGLFCTIKCGYFWAINRCRP